MINNHLCADVQYENLVRYVLANGDRKPNRTGTDTLSVFGYQMRFNLRDGTIPLLTTKKMFTRGIIHEILWYLMGVDNINYLVDNDVHIWDDWAKEGGYVGRIYGVQWRNWQVFTPTGDVTTNRSDFWKGECKTVGTLPTFVQTQNIDQIATLIHTLKTNPNDRRMIVSAWNVADLADMGLPPCHYTFQCYAKPLSVDQRIDLARKQYHATEILEGTVAASIEGWLDGANIPKHELSMMLNQRSCDVALGVPFNIVQYSIMLRMLAHIVNMTPGEFIWNGGDVHVYENHVSGLNTQLEREPMSSPSFNFTRTVPHIDGFKFDDFDISGYTSHPTIKFDVAV